LPICRPTELEAARTADWITSSVIVGFAASRARRAACCCSSRCRWSSSRYWSSCARASSFAACRLALDSSRLCGFPPPDSAPMKMLLSLKRPLRHPCVAAAAAAQGRREAIA